MAKIVLTHEDLIRAVTKQEILDRLAVQQGSYMKKKGLSDTPVRPRQLKKYARLCYRALKGQIKACDSPREFTRLGRALAKRLKPNKREFLNAAGL